MDHRAWATGGGGDGGGEDGACGYSPAALGWMAAFALLFTAVYNASGLVCRRWSATYRALPARMRVRWDNRVTSTFHALVVVPACLWAFLATFSADDIASPHLRVLGCRSHRTSALFLFLFVTTSKKIQNPKLFFEQF